MTPWSTKNERLNRLHRTWVAFEMALRNGGAAERERAALLLAIRDAAPGRGPKEDG